MKSVENMQPKLKTNSISLFTEHEEELVRHVAGSIEYAELQLSKRELDSESFKAFVRSVTSINQIDELLVIQSRKDSIRKAFRKMRLEIRNKYT